MNYDYDDAEKLGIFPYGKNTQGGDPPNMADKPPAQPAGIPYSAYTQYNPAAPVTPSAEPPRDMINPQVASPQPPASPNHKTAPIHPPAPNHSAIPGRAIQSGITSVTTTPSVPKQPVRAPREPWSEPAYSAVPERVPSAYSPGPSQTPYQLKTRQEQHESRREQYGGRRRGGFARAVCLVLVCALASAGATLGVLEFKGIGGDQTAPAAEASQPGGIPSQTPDLAANDQTAKDSDVTPRPVSNNGDVLTAEEIYLMACRQVVVVKTDVASQSNFFGYSGSSVISGSGYIIKEDGYIVTNYHVVESAYKNGDALTVTLYNGDVYPAIIIGLEKNNDVAVIKIEASGLDAVSIGDSSEMRVGESVYAVGNPLGELIFTITDGIVSALDRDITVDGVKMNMFQISAAVNSGNSGGPVYDTYGNVLGMVTAKLNNSTVEGIGFAIPINDVMRIASQVMGHGYIVDSKAYFGITVETVDSAAAEYYNWVVGAYVKSVTPGTCAEKAGLMVGDIITKVGTIDVTSRDSLTYAKKCFNAGDTTEITVRRNGEDITLTVTFDEEPETP